MNESERAIQQCREILNKWYMLQLYENPEASNKFFRYWSECDLEMLQLIKSFGDKNESHS